MEACVKVVIDKVMDITGVSQEQAAEALRNSQCNADTAIQYLSEKGYLSSSQLQVSKESMDALQEMLDDSREMIGDGRW